MRKFFGTAAVVAASMSLLIMAGCGGKSGGSAAAPGSDRSAAISYGQNLGINPNTGLEQFCIPTGVSSLTVCSDASQSPNCAMQGSVLMALDKAVELVDCGGAISVMAGTYTGNITINKPITIIGPNANTNACSGRTDNEAIIDGTLTFAPNNYVADDPGPSDVTINGITITGAVYFPPTTLGERNQILYTDMQQGIQYMPAGADLSTVTFACTSNWGDCIGLADACAPPPVSQTCQDIKDSQVIALQSVLDNLVPIKPPKFDNKGRWVGCSDGDRFRGNADSQHVANAIRELKQSLDKYNSPKDTSVKWAGDCTLNCKYGKKAIEDEREAVEQLEQVKSVDVSASIAAIVAVDRQLAVNEIAAAGSCKDVAAANKMLAEGDKYAASTRKGQNSHAIQKYRYAWFKASNCICAPQKYKWGPDRDRDERDEGDFDRYYPRDHYCGDGR